MRILAFFLHPSEYGKTIRGVERRFLEMASRLQNSDIDLLVLEYKPSISELWGYPSYDSVKLTRRFRNHTLFEMMRLTFHGLRACIRSRCDVIYVPDQSFSAGLHNIPPYLVSVLYRKPIVIVFHHLRQGERKTLRLLAYNRAKVCIAVSQTTANEIIKAFKISNVVVTGNGVNFERFRLLKGSKKVYEAVYFGRISEDKGISILLRAWKRVIERSPPARLLLMGGMEKSVKDYYGKLVEELGLSQNVTFTGFVTDQEAIKMINSSRLFVLPSLEEGFGLTVLEAMATGLPCILTNIPALRENFDPPAVFVEPQDPEQLSRAILALLSNPEKRQELGQKGRKLAKQFSWDKVAEKELHALNKVMV